MYDLNWYDYSQFHFMLWCNFLIYPDSISGEAEKSIFSNILEGVV
jgi:hypothetical protein